MRTLPQATGPTENALRALLDRQLAQSSIPDYLAWVCLNLSTAATSRSRLEAQLRRETQCGADQAAATVERLVALGLLSPDAGPTPDGQAQLTATRRDVKAIAEQLVVGLSEDDLARVIRVLDHVRERAESILSS